jgi:hypothetical protein
MHLVGFYYKNVLIYFVHSIYPFSILTIYSLTPTSYKQSSCMKIKLKKGKKDTAVGKLLNLSHLLFLCAKNYKTYQTIL